jgi:hypothetical protein
MSRYSLIRAVRQKIPVSDSTLIRLAVLAGLMVGLVGIGFATTRVSPELVLIAVATPPVVLLATSRLEYGVLAIIVSAAFVRFSLPTGTQSRIVTSLLMTTIFIALWLGRMLVLDRKLVLKPSSTNVPLLAFILTNVISYAWSNAFRDPLVVVWSSWPVVQLGGLGMMILLPGAFVLTANSVSETLWLKLICWLMVLVGIMDLAAHFLHINLSFLNTRGLFSLWFVSLAFAQALFNKKLPVWLRLVLLGLVGAWMYVRMIENVAWLSGWLPSLVAIGVISFFKSKRLLLILILLLTIHVVSNKDYYMDTVLADESEASGNTRLAAWEHNWRVTGKHLLFGTGPAGYAAYYMSYFPTEGMATHNNYIDILAQTGIVGLFFCMWFLGALGWTGHKLRLLLRGCTDFNEGFANATWAGWVGCIVAMGLGDWMFPFVYTQTISGFDYGVYNWVLLGGIVALSNIYTTVEATEVGDD